MFGDEFDPNPEGTPAIYRKKGTHATVSSIEEGRQLLKEFAVSKNHERNAFALLMEKDDGTLKVHFREGQPCFGEMRKYGPNSNHPNDYKPTDLWTPFPEGKLKALSVPFGHRVGKSEEGVDLLFDFFTTRENPWQNVFHKAIRVDRGLMFYKVDFDPTVLVNGLIEFRNSLGDGPNNVSRANRFADNLKKYGDKYSASVIFFVTSNQCLNYGESPPTYTNWSEGNNYTVASNSDLYNHFHGIIPENLSGGLYSEGFDYNRKDLAFVWGTKERKVSSWKNLSNLRILGGRYESHIEDEEALFGYFHNIYVNGEKE